MSATPLAERISAIAARARALAEGCGVRLPHDLLLWELNGDQTGSHDHPAPGPTSPDEAAWELVGAVERSLSTEERRRGAHYTPRPVADRIAQLALPDASIEGPVVDPACGAGALLLAAAQRLTALGHDRAAIARDRLVGADLDPLAVAAAEAAIAIWSGGVAPSRGHLVVGDPLGQGPSVWPALGSGSAAAVVGNPPFQGQLAQATARTAAEADRVRRRFGAAVGPYVDTAALFLLVGLELAAPGARVAMVQPQSTAAARDAAPVREELARRARLVELWAPAERLFAARVHVCVPVLEVGEGDGRASWAAEVAAARGVPKLTWAGSAGSPGASTGATTGERAQVLASFRDHYYGLVGHVSEAEPGEADEELHPLVTAGAVGLGHTTWGSQPVRFAKRWWRRPTVEVAAVRAASRRLDGWLDVVLAPKVVVATQTKVVEAAADRHGRWVPSTPTISVVPHHPRDLERILVAVCSPPASAWLAARAAGSALSADTLRVTRSLLEALPLPTDEAAWDDAVAALAAADLTAFARAGTAMHRLRSREREEVISWWTRRARAAWPDEERLR